MITLTIGQFAWICGLLGFGAGIILMILLKYFWKLEVIEE